MKKIIHLWLISFLTITSISGTYAWGGWLTGANFTYDQSDLTQSVEWIADKDLKNIISKNLLSASQNSITEDWDYNNKNYYTKKLLLSIHIPDGLKEKVNSAYIILWVNQNPIMPMYDSKITPTSIDSSSNTAEYKIDIDKNSIPSEIKIVRSDFDKYIKDPNGASFNGKLVLELIDGTNLPYSTMANFYLTKDNVDGKLAQLSSLYYAQNPSAGWANTQDLLKVAFQKLQEKYKKPIDYITILEKVLKKVDSRLESVKTEQTKLVEWIRSEEDFPKLVEPASKLADKSTILTDIKYQIASEIKTKQSEEIINDIFSEDTK